MPTQDPLNVFFALRAQILGGQQPFQSGEHVWLGNEGAARAVTRRKLASFGPFARMSAPETLTYGEIVAFSGDFYESPEELWGEKPATVPWLYQPNNVAELLAGIREELDWIERPAVQRGSSYPDENIAFWWHAKRYVELSLKNTPHFGWHNALMYARWHAEALRQVAQAANAETVAARSLAFARAVYTNGFADHFLSDGFAAGHVRAPAAQVRHWAAREGFDEKLAGVLLKLLHDQDGHVNDVHGRDTDRSPNAGLAVRNSRGDTWRTRCDGQLFLLDPGAPAIEQAVCALEESVGEFLDVYNGAPLPSGVFPAARRIPWADLSELALVDKFPAALDDAGATRLWKSMGWYLKLPYVSAGVRPEHIQRLHRALPEIVAAFQRDVAADAAANADLVARLPPEYVAAYRAVR